MGIKVRGTTAAPAVGNRQQPLGSSDGWEDAPSEFTTRVVFMDIYGDTGTGRTSLALSAPGPIAIAHTAEKVNGVVQRFVKAGKVIRMVNFGGEFRGSPQEIADEAAPVWNKMRALWLPATTRGGWCRSAVMDTATEGWEIIRLARFGELNPKGRIDRQYAPVNAEWRGMFMSARQEGATCNIITIHQTQDEYIDRVVNGKEVSTKTGRRVRKAQKGMDFAADVIVETSKDPMTGVFKAQIIKGWWDAMSEGTVLTGEDITFSNIMSVVTSTDPSEWEK